MHQLINSKMYQSKEEEQQENVKVTAPLLCTGCPANSVTRECILVSAFYHLHQILHGE